MTPESGPIVARGSSAGTARQTAADAARDVAAAPAPSAGRPSDGLVYVNGTFRTSAEATVSVFDHGLLYGDGVFEGIRAYNGRVFRLERHIERLFDSAKAIRLTIPHTLAEVCDIVVETCRRNQIHDGYIRLVVT